jgi:hypothetical protein
MMRWASSITRRDAASACAVLRATAPEYSLCGALVCTRPVGEEREGEEYNGNQSAIGNRQSAISNQQSARQPSAPGVCAGSRGEEREECEE